MRIEVDKRKKKEIQTGLESLQISALIPKQELVDTKKQSVNKIKGEACNDNP